MQKMWGALKIFQLITHLSLIGLSLPVNVFSFFAIVNSVSSFNVIPLDSFINFLFSSDDLEDDVPFNAFYNNMGYNGTNFVRNAETIFVTILGLMVIFILTSFLILFDCSNR